MPYAVTADASGPKHMNTKLTRGDLNKLVDGLIDKTKEPCRNALKDAGLQTSDINEVCVSCIAFFCLFWAPISKFRE
jgi:molecular chaperone DnaK